MSLVSYCLYCFPILISTLAVPPFSYSPSVGGERLNSTELSDLLEKLYDLHDMFLSKFGAKSKNERSRSYSYLKQLCLDIETQNKVRFSSKWITHLFIHSNYHHLFNNLSAILSLGFPVFSEYGAFGFYFLFFFGGIVSALPSYLHTDLISSYTKHLDNSDKTRLRDFGKQLLPDFAEKYWAAGADFVVANLMKASGPSFSCGSSGAACALMGCETWLSLHEISNVILSGGKEKSSEVKKLTAVPTLFKKMQLWLDEMRQALWPVCCSLISNHHLRIHLFSSIQGAIYLFKEYKMIYSSAGAGGGSLIGHSAHVQGFLFGAIFGYIAGGLKLGRTRR